jgi:hypothetical protein
VKRQEDDWAVGLDSLLDVVTNAIGFLVLVALLTALDSQNMSILLGTPLVREPPSGTQRVLFECRHSRIVQIDEAAIHQNIRQHLGRYMPRPGTPPDLAQIQAILQRADAGNRFYRVHADIRDQELAFVYEPRADDQGETLEAIRQPSSQYATAIRTADPKKHFAYFIVRQDSFELYREARQIARDHGLAVGWAPHADGEELRFSEKGAFGDDVQD